MNWEVAITWALITYCAGMIVIALVLVDAGINEGRALDWILSKISYEDTE